MRKCYQLTESREEDFSAWNKAPSDIVRILFGMGFSQLSACRTDKTASFLSRVFVWLRAIMHSVFCFMRMSSKDIVLMQSPSPKWDRSNRWTLAFFKKLLRFRLIVIVHDIIGFRSGNGERMSELETSFQSHLVSFADKIIVHNDSMRQWYINRGMPPDHVVALEIFDYLAKSDNAPKQHSLSNNVVVAGCLAVELTGFLRQLEKLDGLDWILYGSRFDASAIHGENIHYKGVFGADDLPDKLDGSFGLIWYGDRLDTVSSYLTEYLKIITPHKLSLYLSAGMPVIVWREMAIADFVTRQNVGLVVDSMLEIPTLISKMLPDAYEDMAANARKVGLKLRNGYYTRTAVEQVLGGGA